MDKFESLRGRALFFICLAWLLWFLNFTCRTTFAPILPLLEDEFGVTHARAAAIFTWISFGYGFSLFFSGVFATFLGSRKSVLVSVVLSALLFSLFSLVKVFEVFYILGFALGMAVGIYLPSMLSLLTDYYDERIWGRVISIHDSGASINTTIVPFLTLFILSLLPWRGIFIVVGIASLLAAVVFFLASHEVTMAERRNYFLISLWKRRSLCIMAVLFIFAGGASLGLYFITPLYLVKELSLDVSYANTIFGISRIGASIVAISAGFLVDRFSLKKALFVIVFSSGLLTVALGLCSVAWVPVVLFLQAAAIIGFFPVAFVAISRIFDRESRGQAIGFVATVNVIFGSGIAPYLLGLSGDLVGFRFGICLIGILTTLSSGLLYFLKELR
jgi:NNP family nitrate/nitrite transporter-like MFS transporter